MASEWIAVIGTSVGVGIGGLVTVASMIVKGNQESAAERRRMDQADRHRREDRTESRLQQNIEERREIYRRLLRAAEAALATTYDVQACDPATRQQVEAMVACMNAYDHVASEVDVIALDLAVVTQAKQFGKSIGETPDLPAGQAGDEDDESYLARTREHDVVVKGWAMERERDLDRLREACRNDVGLTASDASASRPG